MWLKKNKKTAEDNKKNDNAREVQKPNKEKEMIIFLKFIEKQQAC